MKINTTVILLYLGFLTLGLPSAMLGIVWPNMRLDFNQSLDKLGFIIAIVTLSSSFSSYTTSYLLTKIKISSIIILGSILMLIGICGYVMANQWIFILLSAMFFGLGSGLLNCGLNNYSAKNLNSRHVNWLHGFWGVGSMTGSLILTAIYAFNMNWRIGYIVVFSILLILFFTFIKTRSCWIENTSNIPKTVSDKFKLNFDIIISSLFYGLNAVLEASVALFLYSYLVEYKEISAVKAGIIISLYWGFFTLGRFLIGYITKWVSNSIIIVTSIISSITIMFLIWLDFYYMFAILGIAFAGVCPCTVSETHKRFKSHIADKLMGIQIGTAGIMMVLFVPFVGFLLENIGLKYFSAILIFISSFMFLLNLRLSKLSRFK